MALNFILSIALILSCIYMFYRIQFFEDKKLVDSDFFQAFMMTSISILLLLVPINLGTVTLSFFYIPILFLLLYNTFGYKLLSTGIVFVVYYFIFDNDLIQFFIFLGLVILFFLIVPFIRTPKMTILVVSNFIFTGLYLVMLHLFVAPISLNAGFLFVIFSSLATFLASLFYTDIQNLIRLYKQVEEEKFFDPLTKLGNIKTMDTHLDEMFLKSDSMSILLIDIDNFKLINDLQGFESGDRLIKQLADLLKNHVPTGGTLFRNTGEEFSIVLGDLNFDSTVRLAEGIRKSVELTKFHVNESQVINMTVSIGIGFVDTKESTRKDLVKIADSMLFAAKKQGQNRVMFAPIG
ncbi:GGDEF domain-containing protein [Phocicoccus pinnipedialis]|uniref:Putative diguanylate cyclase YdaM n=1 Tax=Phocicoccus pinnipedialis TaxID=110845 RepID=A0A6V7R110_9BACL|nr:GGDEF domain-containing protein [Jeotgalicoccus pinnipedialis]MBP1938774.1 diguanylate cyclase (GGDEF)-like protein [Jeotgalicoccus pinnipedialis]CAD2070754.1 putative diguanylate cyclase YdaM [Jeotgalicoccus pinnipedialis]